jgi:hypothetical protein
MKIDRSASGLPRGYREKGIKLTVELVGRCSKGPSSYGRSSKRNPQRPAKQSPELAERDGSNGEGPVKG